MLLSPFFLGVKSTDFSPFCAVLLCVFSRFIQTVLERFSFEDVENPVESVENPLVWPVFHRFRGVFNILWKTFQHNSTDKHPRLLGKLPVLPPVFAGKTYNYYGGFARFFTFHRFSPPRLWTKSEKFILHVECKNSPTKFHPVQAIPAAANQSAAARRTGAALLPPPPYSITTATANRGCCTGPYPMSTEFV